MRIESNLKEKRGYLNLKVDEIIERLEREISNPMIEGMDMIQSVGGDEAVDEVRNLETQMDDLEVQLEALHKSKLGLLSKLCIKLAEREM